ncbi:hypothetical protein [Haloechinothrix salitolerans]|uniref:Secreted protein n=1 Tax=Haloechinothrix salitolerans TaxID=926830 RepID=A0ABW2C2E5_9PSEU
MRWTALWVLLAVLGVLAVVMGETAFAAAADSKPRAAESRVARHSMEADSASEAGRSRCAIRADRTHGPDDHQAKSAQDNERATTRRVIDHQVAGADPDIVGIAPPARIVLTARQPVEDDYDYRAYRTVDGRAPPRARH